jgi:hypothetical protein
VIFWFATPMGLVRNKSAKMQYPKFSLRLLGSMGWFACRPCCFGSGYLVD